MYGFDKRGDDYFMYMLNPDRAGISDLIQLARALEPSNSAKMVDLFHFFIEAQDELRSSDATHGQTYRVVRCIQPIMGTRGWNYYPPTIAGSPSTLFIKAENCMWSTSDVVRLQRSLEHWFSPSSAEQEKEEAVAWTPFKIPGLDDNEIKKIKTVIISLRHNPISFWDTFSKEPSLTRVSLTDALTALLAIEQVLYVDILCTEAQYTTQLCTELASPKLIWSAKLLTDECIQVCNHHGHYVQRTRGSPS